MEREREIVKKIFTPDNMENRKKKVVCYKEHYFSDLSYSTPAFIPHQPSLQYANFAESGCNIYKWARNTEDLL